MFVFVFVFAFVFAFAFAWIYLSRTRICTADVERLSLMITGFVILSAKVVNVVKIVTSAGGRPMVR